MEYALGIDVGTTAVKGLVIDQTGKIVALASQPVKLIPGNQGQVEQDAEELWDAVTAMCRAVQRQLPEGGAITGMSLSSQGGTTIPVDGEGKPTHNAFSWMDERAVEEAATVEREVGSAWVYRTTGWTLCAGFPLNHIAWFRKHAASDFARTRYFRFVNDFILERLGGRAFMNPSDASITQLYDLQTGDWDKRLLDIAGIQKSQLSAHGLSGEIVSQLTREAAELTGLSEGIAVVNGAHDQYCAAVATGVTQAGEVMLSCGTAWVVLAVPDAFDNAFQGGMCISRHAIPGMWGAIRSMAGVGATVEWLLNLVWREEKDAQARYTALNQAAESSPCGANGLFFTPLCGGHMETGAPANRGILGLTLQHNRSDIARGMMEGIAMELDWTLEEIRQAIPVRRLKMIGGAARSAIWAQIVADVCGVPVDLPRVSDAAAYGAAILAGVGLGWYNDARQALDVIQTDLRICMPDPDQHARYTGIKKHYQKLWGLLPHQYDGENGGWNG